MEKLYKVVNGGEKIECSEEEQAQYLFDLEQYNTVFLPSDIRSERNAKLAATDWTQAGDVPQSVKDSYAIYRQALRDVPQQPGFPTDVIWPTKP